MAPEIAHVRRTLRGRLDFDLALGGINVGNDSPLRDSAKKRFRALWREVNAVTGQQFCMRTPSDPEFIYNSRPACLAVMAARVSLSAPPFEFLESMQRAFFLDARNVTAREIIEDLVHEAGIDLETFREALESPAVSRALDEEMGGCRRFGTQALPAVLVETESGRRLFAGGYVSHDFLVQGLEAWLTDEPPTYN